jgi:hypothetical protein
MIAAQLDVHQPGNGVMHPRVPIEFEALRQ